MSDTPECDALMKNPLDSNDIYAWRRLAWHLQRQRDELAAALRFYADPSTYETHQCSGPEDPPDFVCPIGEDQGEHARALLARIEEGK